jgi:hypothetical protein
LLGTFTKTAIPSSLVRSTLSLTSPSSRATGQRSTEKSLRKCQRITRRRAPSLPSPSRTSLSS